MGIARLGYAALLTIALAACGGPIAGNGGIDSVQALQQAETLREGCVARTLDLVLTAVEQIAPLAEAGGIDSLMDLVQGSDFTVGPALESPREYLLVGEWTDLDGNAYAFRAWLGYSTGGIALLDPAYADELFVRLELTGTGGTAYSEFNVRPEPGRGLVVDGGIDAVDSGSGCRVSAVFPEIVALPIADLPGSSARVLIQTGSFDMQIDGTAGSSPSSARAALSGRSAIVAINVGGFFLRGDIDLVHPS